MSTNPDNRQASVIELLAATLSLTGVQDPLLCFGIETKEAREAKDGEDGEDGKDAKEQTLSSMQSALLAHLQGLIAANSSAGEQALLVGNSLSRLASEPDLSDRNLQVENNFAASKGRYELIVVEGSIRFLDQLPLLTTVRKSLNNNGAVILFGEYLDDDSAIARSELANLSSLKQLAERLGFQMHLEESHSTGAAKSLQIFIDLVADFRQQLIEREYFSAEQLQVLEQELQHMAAEFSSGRRCFRIFVFTRLADPPGEYAHAEYGDIHSFEPGEVKGLFEASFGVDFDPDLWQWKYQLGQGTCVVAREAPGKAIVSHYGGAPRKIDYFGVPQMAIQPCDVMVLPEVRRQYGKNSLFFKTAATFLEREIGNTVKHLLGFGFPNQKAMNIALRLGLYEKTDDFIEVIYPENFNTQSGWQRTEADIDNADHCRWIDNLWQAMREGYREGIIGVRDAAYIRYRYFDHPFAGRGQYERFFVFDPDTQEPIAFVVLKAHDQHSLLMDLVCAPASMGEVLAMVNQYSVSAEQAAALKIWLTRGWQRQVDVPGSTVNELGIEIPCNSWNPGPSSSVLYGAWWLTAGDMDFM